MTDLPEPDSPTSASVSPLSSRKGDAVDGDVRLPPWRKATDRSRPREAVRRSSEGLSRIERVAHRLADEDEERQHERDDEEAGDAEPRRLQILLALVQQLAERGRAGRQAEAQKVERGQRGDRAGDDERHEGHASPTIALGSRCLNMILRVGEAERARGADIFEIARPQELGPHQADQAVQENSSRMNEQDPEARRDERRQDDEQIERAASTSRSR